MLGLLAGYKQFFTHKFGLRYYGLFNYGSYQGLNGTDFSVKNLNVNVDALYNFVANELDGFGVFGGLSLGYAEQKYPSTGYTRDGLDFGINLGFKGNFLSNQSAEFFTRFGLLGP